MPFAVAGHLSGIDRVDEVPGGDQRLHPRSAVGLDADHDLVGFGVLVEVIGDQSTDAAGMPVSEAVPSESSTLSAPAAGMSCSASARAEASRSTAMT